MNKYILSILLSFFTIVSIGQAGFKKTVRVDSALATSNNTAMISEDKIITTGFNFYGDSSHIGL